MDDIIIIGGGIAGISAGARLSALGRVTVLEMEDGLGYHASGRSAALFEASYGKPSTIALNRASHDYHATANGGVLSPRGLLLVGREGERDAFDRDRAAMDLTPVSLDEAVAMIPILNPAKVAHAAHHDEAWDIDTDRLIQNFAREIRANGGTILTRRKADAIQRTASGWAVRSGDDLFEAPLLVDAAGAWADQVAVMAGVTPLGLTPLRRSMAQIPAPGGHDVSRWPMIFGTGESWYAKPEAGKLLVSPADEDPAEPHDAWADDMVLAEGLARYEEVVTEPVTRLETSWAGLRTFAPDRCLAIGFAPDDPAFLWVAGQGGYGMQSSPAASQLAADLVAGRKPELDDNSVADLSPARFS